MEDTASLVALVQAPDPTLKNAILKAYQNEIFTTNETGCPDHELEFLRGEKILIEKGADEGETGDLTGEKQAILCMHLWSRMKEADVSDPQKIWEAISKGWPECVSWEKIYHGHFWAKIYKEKKPLRDQAVNMGMSTFLAAYKDMERHFKGDNQHFLVNWPSAYDPKEENPNPNPTLSIWEDMITACTEEDAKSLLKCLSVGKPKQSS